MGKGIDSKLENLLRSLVKVDADGKYALNLDLVATADPTGMENAVNSQSSRSLATLLAGCVSKQDNGVGLRAMVNAGVIGGGGAGVDGTLGTLPLAAGVVAGDVGKLFMLQPDGLAAVYQKTDLGDGLAGVFELEFTGSVSNGRASAVINFPSNPKDGQQFSLNVNGANHYFTFKTASKKAGEVAIGADTAATLANLINELGDSDFLNDYESVTANGSDLTIVLKPNFGDSPNNNWYVDYNGGQTYFDGGSPVVSFTYESDSGNIYLNGYEFAEAGLTLLQEAQAFASYINNNHAGLFSASATKALPAKVTLTQTNGDPSVNNISFSSNVTTNATTMPEPNYPPIPVNIPVGVLTAINGSNGSFKMAGLMEVELSGNTDSNVDVSPAVKQTGAPAMVIVPANDGKVEIADFQSPIPNVFFVGYALSNTQVGNNVKFWFNVLPIGLFNEG